MGNEIKRIFEVKKAAKLNLTDKVPLGQGNKEPVTATIQQISDFVGNEQHIADKATTIDLSKVKQGDTIAENPSHCLFHYANAPVHYETCTHEGVLYYIVCAWHGFNNKGQVYYAFSGKQCTNVWSYSDVPDWVKDCFLEFVKDQMLTDAPKDGKQYARKDGEWNEVEGMTEEEKKKLSELWEIIGMYQDREPITLEAEQTGKAIVPITDGSQYGKVEAMAGASVSKEYQVTRGDLLKIKSGKTSNALFTVSQVVTNKDGSKTYTKVMSLNELAEWPLDGYLNFLAMPSDMTIVVTFFAGEPGFDATVKVKRSGTFASVCTQVGNIYQELHSQYMRIDGYSALARTGMSDALTPNGENVPVYDEIITAARMVNDAPELIGERVPSATNGTSNIRLDGMRGDVIGGNQKVKNPTFSNPDGTFSSAYWHDGYSRALVDNGDGTVSKPSTAGSFKTQTPIITGHKHVVIFSGIGADAGSHAVFGFTKGESTVQQFADLTSTSMKHYSLISSTSAEADGIFIGSLNKVSKNGVVLQDLQTLFPTDPNFVNSLTADDAIKVLHRLGVFVYNRDAAGNATQLADETLAKGAEVLAKLGYQPEPKLWFGSVGRTHLIDGNTGRKKQTLDMIAAKTQAWSRVLAVLNERGIDVPGFAQKPIEFSINDEAGVKWDNKGVTVNAWCKILGNNNWTIKTIGSSRIFWSQAYNDASMKREGALATLAYRGNLEHTKDNTISYSYKTTGLALNVHDDSVADLDAFKAKIEGQYLVYELDEPIRIDFDEEINLNLVDVKPYDLYAMDDIDGNAMYDISIEQNEDGTIKTTACPNAEWVERNKQLPVGIHSQIIGLGTNVNYDFVMKLEQRVRALENK